LVTARPQRRQGRALSLPVDARRGALARPVFAQRHAAREEVVALDDRRAEALGEGAGEGRLTHAAAPVDGHDEGAAFAGARRERPYRCGERGGGHRRTIAEGRGLRPYETGAKGSCAS
jgi:hypothetical protein